MHRSRSFYLLIFFQLILFLQVSSQELVLKNYKVREGLPSSEVYCVLQDSKGFIWFGTDGGVSRFDGYTFKNYTTENGLADNTVFGIQEDRHGRLWFRSLSGKLCYWENDSVFQIGANELISRYMKNSLMVSFFIDKGDTVWCGLKWSDSYYKLSPGYGVKNFQQINPAGGGFYLIETDEQHSITGNVPVKKPADLRLISFYQKQNIQKQITNPDLQGSHIYYSKIRAGTFLGADKESLFLIHYNDVFPLLNTRQIYKTQTACLKKAGNYFWLGLMGRGVLRFDINDNFSLKKPEQILNGYSVTDVMTDDEGGTWFTTLENGVYYSSPDKFVSYGHSPDASADKGYSVSKPVKNNIIISNHTDRVDIITPDSIVQNVGLNSGARLRPWLEPGDLPFLLLTTGNTFKQDSFMSYLWVQKSHQLKKLVDTLNQKRLIRFSAIDKNHKKIYLIDRYFIFTADGSSDFIKVVAPLPARVLALDQDKNGVLWLGCINGLWSFSENRFIYHGDENILLKNTIEDIKTGEDGTRYYATRGSGVIVFKNGHYTKLTTVNGLPSNNCKCLYTDEKNNTWIGSKSGICRLRHGTDGWEVQKFNLSADEFSNEVQHIEKTGTKLWLFTNGGILSYEQNNITKELPPRIYTTEFPVNEINHIKDTIRVFSYDENYIKIAYVGLSFRSTGKLYYKYKMDGLDTAWHSTQNTFIQYPFLPPGVYKFNVKAVSFNGVESKNPVTVSFTIKNPYWKSWWFFITTLLFLAGTGYLLFQYWLKAIKKKEEEKTLVNKQLAGLEMKALRAQMNPHFIFNAINSIQNYIVKNDSRTAQDYLAKFARLIRSVLENSKQERVSLANELEALELYVELEQLRAPDKFVFSISRHPDLAGQKLLIPPLLLQPYIENAILHGLIPLADGKGHLNVQLEKKEGKLICIIEDNGIGRKKAGELKQKKQASHRSMGLSVTEERIKLMDPLHKSEAGITIEDKTDEQGNPKGTKVILSIPVE